MKKKANEKPTTKKPDSKKVTETGRFLVFQVEVTKMSKKAIEDLRYALEAQLEDTDAGVGVMCVGSDKVL